jgi:uncharacterized protein involved in exopolysaccharide biosynthesis
VQVKEPSEVRKNILETLRDIVGVLKRFEKFRHIRHEKLERINKLRGLVKETNKVLGTLKAKLPQTNLRVTVARETQKQPKKTHHRNGKKAKVVEEKMPKKEMTETDKLEAELSAIEDKLKSLT